MEGRQRARALSFFSRRAINRHHLQSGRRHWERLQHGRRPAPHTGWYGSVCVHIQVFGFLMALAYLAVFCLCNLSTLYLIIDASYSYVTTSALRPLCTIYVHRPSYYSCQTYPLARVILFNLTGTYTYSHAFSQSGGPSSQDSEWGRGIAGLGGVYPCHRQHVRQRIRRLVRQDRIDRDMQ